MQGNRHEVEVRSPELTKKTDQVKSSLKIDFRACKIFCRTFVFVQQQT